MGGVRVGFFVARGTGQTHGSVWQPEAGMGLIEMTIASAVLAIALLGTMIGVLSGYRLVLETKSTNLAHHAATAVVEEFQNSAAGDFEAALLRFHRKTDISEKMKVKSEVVLDETSLETPMDLNGDGDTNDANLSPSDVKAAFLRTTVSFPNGRERSFTMMIPRRANTRAAKRKQRRARRRGAPKVVLDTVADVAREQSADGLCLDVDCAKSVVRIARVVRSTREVTGELTADDKVWVVAMRVDASKQAFIKRVEIGGVRRFVAGTAKAPTGSILPMFPFRLDAGTTALDCIRFQRGRDMRRVELAVTLYLSSGAKAVFRM